MSGRILTLNTCHLWQALMSGMEKAIVIKQPAIVFYTQTAIAFLLQKSTVAINKQQPSLSWHLLSPRAFKCLIVTYIVVQGRYGTCHHAFWA